MNAATVLELTAKNPFEDESLFEIIDGIKVEILPMRALARRVTNRLGYFVNAHAIPANLGEANVENLFHLALPVDRNRRPDLAYVSYSRWPKASLCVPRRTHAMLSLVLLPNPSVLRISWKKSWRRSANIFAPELS